MVVNHYAKAFFKTNSAPKGASEAEYKAGEGTGTEWCGGVPHGAFLVFGIGFLYGRDGVARHHGKVGE